MRFSQHELRWAGVVFFTAAVLFLLNLIVLRGADLPEAARRLLVLATTALLLTLAVIVATRVRLAWVIALGAALNLTVIAANGGGMPVEFSTAADMPALRDRLTGETAEEEAGHLQPGTKDIPMAREDIVLFALADRLELQLPVLGAGVYSIGDLLLYLGFGLAWVETTVRVVTKTQSGTSRIRPAG